MTKDSPTGLLAYFRKLHDIVHFLDVVSRQGTQTSKVSPEQSLLLATLNRKQHTEQNPIPPIHRHPPCPVRCQSLRRRHSRRWHKRPSLCGRVFALDDLSSGIDHFSPFKVGIVGLTLLRFHGCSCTMLYLYTVSSRKYALSQLCIISSSLAFPGIKGNTSKRIVNRLAPKHNASYILKEVAKKVLKPGSWNHRHIFIVKVLTIIFVIMIFRPMTILLRKNRDFAPVMCPFFQSQYMFEFKPFHSLPGLRK